MAKVIGPGLSLGMRGSVGKIQYRKVKRDNIVCLNHGGVRSVSASQAVVRAHMVQIAALYHTLSAVQLGAWRKYGALFNFRWGGFAYFTYINMPLARAGSPLLSWPAEVPWAWVSQYPPVQNGTYVKSTSENNGWHPYFATNPTKSLIGSASNGWIAGNAITANQRFHIDFGLGNAPIMTRIYYENYHNTGGATTGGVKNFILQGSNSDTAFANLVYSDDTSWDTIMTGQMVKHVDLNQPDSGYITVNNTTAYKYYAFKFVNNWTGGLIGVRRIELQSVEYAP